MKQVLNLLTFCSSFQKQEADAIRNAHIELFTALDDVFDINIVFPNAISEHLTTQHIGADILFIATGGVEGMVVEKYPTLPHPITLLTDGKANSLAASLELACWTRQQGDECKILHGSMNTVISELKQLCGKALMKGQKIGVIGKPSDWLVSSNVDYALAKQNWGVEFIDIPLTEVEENYSKITSVEVEADADAFISNATSCREPNRDEVIKAMRLYRAIKGIVKKYELNALTLQCFNLIPTTCTTGCLALALLNDEDIPAGCEGDLQSIFTMLYVKRAMGKFAFMANPSRIDIESNSIILAHCTIGLKMVDSYIIRSHFESQSGVAIQGKLPIGKVRIIKIGGSGLERKVELTGKIVENQDDERKCRTQILIQLDADSDVRYFLNNSIGNHHIIVLE